MCTGCVQRYLDQENLDSVELPPEHEDLVDRIGRFHEMEGCGVGGPLHIVLDDTNIEDDHIRWCLSRRVEPIIDKLNGTNYSDYPDEVWTEAEAIAEALLAIDSLSMRALVVTRA